MKLITTTAGWAMLMLGAPASAAVLEKLDFQSYSVSAQQGDNLGSLISAAYPFKEDRGAHGYTHWNYRWNARWSPDNGGCRVTDAVVSLDLTVTLPRLDAGTPEQHKAFADYLPRLREHEMGHVDTSRAGARAVDAYLRALRIEGGCQAMQRIAADGVNQLLERNNIANREYDARTDHGRTQGARIAAR